MYSSRFMPCPECGASVDGSSHEPHFCDPERALDYRLFGLRDELGELEQEITGYLDSPEGRFGAWYAARNRP